MLVRTILALFALLALIVTPLSSAMAVPIASDHCASMSHHGQKTETDTAPHQCCSSAMPSLPDRAAVVILPDRLAPVAPVETALTLTLSARPHIEIRPPRTV